MKRTVMTVKQFKEVVSQWPELDSNGEPSEVFMTSGCFASTPVVEVLPLNGDRQACDMLIHTPVFEEGERCASCRR